jgi:hypothetical protein
MRFKKMKREETRKLPFENWSHKTRQRVEIAMDPGNMQVQMRVWWTRYTLDHQSKVLHGIEEI